MSNQFQNGMCFLAVCGVFLLSACTGEMTITPAQPVGQPEVTSTNQPISPTLKPTTTFQRIPYLTLLAPPDAEPIPKAEWGIYLVESDGENLQRLTEAGKSYRYPQFSRDGDQIACVLERDDSSESLVVYRLDTQEEESLFMAGGEIVDFAWAPDSSRIALLVKTEKNTAHLTLYDFESGILEEQLEWEGGLDSLSWSYDSRYLAFAGSEPTSDLDTPRYEGPITEVYIFDTLDGQLTQLTSTDGRAFEPAWSPTEYALAYEDRGSENTLDTLQLMYPFIANKAPIELTTLSFTKELIWSPNGVRIAYGGPIGADTINVYDGTTSDLIYGIASYYPISWSGDSKMVLVEVWCCDAFGTYIIDTEKINEENPTEAWSEHPRYLNEGQWSPVEDLIVFTSSWDPTAP